MIDSICPKFDCIRPKVLQAEQPNLFKILKIHEALVLQLFYCLHLCFFLGGGALLVFFMLLLGSSLCRLSVALLEFPPPSCGSLLELPLLPVGSFCMLPCLRLASAATEDLLVFVFQYFYPTPVVIYFCCWQTVGPLFF